MFDLYKKTFCKGSFGIQGGYNKKIKDQDWVNLHDTLKDLTIHQHLAGVASIAVLPPNYPEYVILDVDAPLIKDPSSDLFSVLVRLESVFRLKQNDYVIFASPSFENDRSFHLFFKVSLGGKPPTKGQIEKRLLPLAKKAGIEMFPNGNFKLRAPLGWKQVRLKKDSFEPLEEPWEKSLEVLIDLEAVDLDHYPIIETRKNLRLEKRSGGSVKKLLDRGLDGGGQRYQATRTLAMHYFFLGLDKNNAEEMIMEFMSTRHNGFSNEINIGNWGQVKRDINNWVGLVYKKFVRRHHVQKHNFTTKGWITREDIELICRHFRSDLVSQKRIFKLVVLIRTLSDGESDQKVIIKAQVLLKLLGHDYKYFLEALETRRLLEINRHYVRGESSRMYQLLIPPAKRSEGISVSNSNDAAEYRRILLTVYGSKINAVLASGINSRWF